MQAGPRADDSLSRRKLNYPLSHCQSLPVPYQPIVRGKVRRNVELGVKILISETGKGFNFFDRPSYDPCNEGEDLKIQAMAFRCRHGHHPALICSTRSSKPVPIEPFVSVMESV